MQVKRQGVLGALAAVVLVAGLCRAASAADGPTCLQAPCEGMRPGAGLLVAGLPCSAGFAFRDARGQRYVSTAGHCAPATKGALTTPDGDRVWPGGRGPVVTDTDGRRIGTVRYATERIDESDFALVQVDPKVPLSGVPLGGGRVDHVGRSVTSGQLMSVVGQGLGVSAVMPGRRALVTGASQAATFTLTVIAAPGDSGGPVFADDGAAAGILVRGGGYVLPDVGTAEVMRLDAMLARVVHQARLKLSLLSR